MGRSHGSICFAGPSFQSKWLNLEKGRKCFSSFTVLFLLGNSTRILSQPHPSFEPRTSPALPTPAPLQRDQGFQRKGQHLLGSVFRATSGEELIRADAREIANLLMSRSSLTKDWETGETTIKFKENQGEDPPPQNMCCSRLRRRIKNDHMYELISWRYSDHLLKLSFQCLTRIFTTL